MMKTRIRNFLLALTIALISLKLFPALDLYALKSLNKLFFDEQLLKLHIYLLVYEEVPYIWIQLVVKVWTNFLVSLFLKDLVSEGQLGSPDVL